MSRIRLDFARGTDLDEAANDLRSALDRIRDDLPPEVDAARDPQVRPGQRRGGRPGGHLHPPPGGADPHPRARGLPPLQADPRGGRGRDLMGGIHRQVRVDLHRDRLRAAGLTALDVEEALRRENTTVPGGNVKGGLSDLYVRPLAEFRTVGEIGRTVVTTVAGQPVHLQDVADVVDGWEDVRYLAEVNGVPSVTVAIQKQSGIQHRRGGGAHPGGGGSHQRRARRRAPHRLLRPEQLHQPVDRQRPLQRAVGVAAGHPRALRLFAQRGQHRHHRRLHPGLDHRLLRAALLRRASPSTR